MTESRSTIWYQNNKEHCRLQQAKQKRTLAGKLANLITTSKYRAKIKGRAHTISVKDLRILYEAQEGLCALSGKRMIIRGTKCAADSPYSISLDRIDPDGGYTQDNIWLVCTGVNLMKSRLTTESFLDFCRCVVENNNA